MKYAYLLLISILIINCSESTQPNGNNRVGLPNEFPLEVGNAWVYERHYYENQIDSMFLDTLYIYGIYDGYYKYSWDPSYYASLVKNENNKLINCGRISKYNSRIDTISYEKPYNWAFFQKVTGYVDTSDYSNYVISFDSTYLSIQYNKEILGKNYDTYVQKKYDTYSQEYRFQYINSLGFVHWMSYDDSTGNLNSETKMVKILKNFYPPDDTTMKNISINNLYKFDLFKYAEGTALLK